MFYDDREWKLPPKRLERLDLPPSSGEGSEIPNLLGPLERANLNNFLKDSTQ
jgi:hypothetical protein